jgi:hypothetical protein
VTAAALLEVPDPEPPAQPPADPGPAVPDPVPPEQPGEAPVGPDLPDPEPPREPDPEPPDVPSPDPRGPETGVSAVIRGVDPPSDAGHPISYQALRRGTRVHASDGTEVGKVLRVLDNAREHIFDGIVIDTRKGRRFVDAPEVAAIAERAVTLALSVEQVAELPVPRSLLRERFEQATVVRRMRRERR